METKKISDLTMLETVSDAANVLVEENGEAKRVPANKLGGASSWNDLTDKPFGDTIVMGDTLTWDGNAEGLAYVEGGLYKISDAVPTFDDFAKGGHVSIGNVSTPWGEGEIAEEDITTPTGIIGLMGVVFVVPAEAVGVMDEALELTFPEAGVYAGAPIELQLNGYTGFEMVVTKSIDEKYLPDVILLYPDENNYLYADSDTSDTSKRITMETLRGLIMSNRTMYVTSSSNNVSVYVLLSGFSFLPDYAQAEGRRGEFSATYYTAEYTPPAT